MRGERIGWRQEGRLSHAGPHRLTATSQLCIMRIIPVTRAGYTQSRAVEQKHKQ